MNLHRFYFYKNYLIRIISKPIKWSFFSVHGISSKQVDTIGLPYIRNLGGSIIIKSHINLTNTFNESTLGVNRRCKFLVYRNAELIFEGKVSMSNTCIVATKKVSIGDNVMIGGGVTIVDSDFHSMDYRLWGMPDDEKNMKSAPVIIGNNVFIGMHSIILKGVTIGENAIIAAGSVVNKSIPDNEIWGGNPAKYIKVRK